MALIVSSSFLCQVDGFGNYFFGDDANVPSLLALPFNGYVAADAPLYQATRKLLLSNRTNPYFYGDFLSSLAMTFMLLLLLLLLLLYFVLYCFAFEYSTVACPAQLVRSNIFWVTGAM
eukprot:COSAG05_NODE_2053_length_3635_cov_2.811086_3_plen_118_part_00